MARLPDLVTHSSFRWTMTYIVVATLWIALVQWLLTGLGGARWAISPAGLVVGGVFVLVTAWLLFLLLERGQPVPLAEQVLKDSRFNDPKMWWGALASLIAFTLLAQLFMVSYATREYRPVLIDQAQTELMSQIHLHSKFINDWLNERSKIADQLLAQSSALANRIRSSQAQPGESSGKSSGNAFPSFVALIQDGRFQSITVFDPDHVKKLKYGANNMEKTPDQLFERAAATSKVQFSCVFGSDQRGGDCYWVLPVFLSQTEVSAGPWYIVLADVLNETGLITSPSVEQMPQAKTGVRTLLLLAQNKAAKTWMRVPLIDHFVPLSKPNSPVRVAPVAGSDLECLRQAPAFLSLQARLSPFPPDAQVLKASSNGQINCQGSTLLYASTQIPLINALIWATTPQEIVLEPLRKTRQWLAAASLIGVLTLLTALFLFWRIMRLRRAKVLAGLRRERDQLSRLWENMPAMGLAIVNPPDRHTDWHISLVNARWTQIFHQSQESLQGCSLLAIIGLDDLINNPMSDLKGSERAVSNTTTPSTASEKSSDRKLLEDTYSGLRDEVTLQRRVRVGEAGHTWVRFHIRALKTDSESAEGLIVAAEDLGFGEDWVNELKAERDFCRLTAAFCYPQKKQSIALPATVNTAENRPRNESLAETEKKEPATNQSRLTVLAEQIIEQSSLVALCLYTHWPEVWSTSSRLTGLTREQSEHKTYECIGCTVPVREIANQVAHMGLIDRVLVAQTSMFIDEDARSTSISGTLQNELIEQLKQYPVGALAIVPIPAMKEGDPVRALIAFGEDNLRFTEPVKTSLINLLKVLIARLDE